MSYIAVVFRSRGETMRFQGELTRGRIPAQIINTPREANLTCGISIKIPENAVWYANKILSKDTYNSFVGFFRIN